MSEKTPATLVETSLQRFDVFLSHNSREKPVVERIAEKLKREGFEPWLDKWSLTPGGDWQDELAGGLRASTACAVFVGPSGIGSWEDLEYKLATDRMAKDRAFRVFLVLLPGLPEPFDASALPPFLSTRTWIDLRKGIEERRGFQSLINGIKGLPLGPERAIEPRNDICPYRGLQPFDEDHSEFFFGRDGDIQRLIEKLKVTRFIAVIGSSGSGKSSLVRAGVVPALKKGVLPESDTWTIRVFTPGAHPLAALAANLLRLYPHEAMNKTLDQLAADERTLHLAVSLGLAERPASERVVWVIDQFEEIFTLCSDEQERAQFLANLLYAAFIPNGRCTVILTLRADFYPKCATYPELSARMSEQQFLVSLMGANNLRQAIEEPAWHVGLEFEQGLVETILDQVENQPGALPLLEHALLELWERRRGQMMTLEAYHESGGVEGAIAKRADAIYVSFNPEQQTIVRRIMLRLTQPGEGTEDTRRRATMSELITREGESQIVEGVVQEMATARLLTTNTDEQSGEQIVDVSHEALIRGWPRLRKWIEEDRAGLRILRRLTEAAREWQTGKDESLLFRGARLAQAVEWRERNEVALNEMEREFLNQSVAQHEAAERRRRRVIIGLAAGLLVALALAGLALFQWWRANEQTQIARSRQLAATSLSVIDTQPDLALLLSVEANRAHESTEARSMLLIDMQYREYLSTFLHGHAAEVHKVVFSPDGKLLASASGTNGTDNSVRLWDVVSGQPVGQPLTGHRDSVVCLTFSPDGKLLASADRNEIILWDVAARKPIGQPLTGHSGHVLSLAFSPDSKLLASGSFGEIDGDSLPTKGEIYLWDVATHERIGSPLKGHNSPVYSLAFSPDGTTLASGGGGNDYYGGSGRAYSIVLWNVAKAQALGSPLEGHKDEVLSLAFSPDGKILASGSADETVKLWDVARLKPVDNSSLLNKDHHTSKVLDVHFTRDGKTLISADDGNHVLMREPKFSPTNGKNLTLESYYLAKAINGYVDISRKIQSIAFSPDESKWAMGGCRKMLASNLCIEGELSIWDAAARLPISHPLGGNYGKVECVAFNPNGKTLASGGCGELLARDCDGGKVNLWDMALGQLIGQPLKAASNIVTSLAYSPDGKILAAGSCSRYEEGICRQGEIQLWNPDTWQPISKPLIGHSDFVKMLAFSPNGEILASSSGDNIILWNVETKQPFGEIIPGHQSEAFARPSPTKSIAFSPDSKTLASSGCGKIRERAGGDRGSTACVEGEIRLWNVATRQLLGAPLVGHTDIITSVAFSPDSKTLASASGSYDRTIRLWSIAARQPIGQAFMGHVAGVKKIIFSPDGETLASVSDASDSTAYNIRLWDVATHQPIGQPLLGHTLDIQDIAFSPNGQTLASGGWDKTLLLWDVNPASWMGQACHIANRNLTHTEWERYFPNQTYRKTCADLPEPKE
jgi:WD40 repeat protein/energy-coupling factor transporter ATP-binding protein EcfA2